MLLPRVSLNFPSLSWLSRLSTLPVCFISPLPGQDRLQSGGVERKRPLQSLLPPSSCYTFISPPVSLSHVRSLTSAEPPKPGFPQGGLSRAATPCLLPLGERRCQDTSLLAHSLPPPLLPPSKGSDTKRQHCHKKKRATDAEGWRRGGHPPVRAVLHADLGVEDVGHGRVIVHVLHPNHLHGQGPAASDLAEMEEALGLKSETSQLLWEYNV